MTPEEAEQKAIKEVNGIMSEDVELLEKYAKLHDRALSLVKMGAAGDPVGKDGAFGEAFWRRAVYALQDPHQWSLPAERLLSDLWNTLTERQRDENNAFLPRAMISQFLTELTFRRGAAPLAFRWALHTQAADILAEHALAGGYGKHWLRGKFGVTDPELQLLNQIASECRKKANETRWSSPSGFPEEVVRRLVTDQAVGLPLLARAITEDEFLICPSYLSALWDVVKNASSANEKGDALEVLASYLCGLLPGCVSQQRVSDPMQAAEYDLLVRSFAQHESLTTSSFGREFIVECKNWEKTVGVKELGYFLFRMGSTRTRFGIMFSKSGISGREDTERAARSLIRREFQQHGSVCVVVEERDILRLANGESLSFQAMLLTKSAEFRFGKPKDSKGA